ANNDSKAYGQAKSYGAGSTAFTTGANQLQNGDSIASVTITDTNNGGLATAAVGTYPLVPSAAVAGGTTNLSNYTITYVNGTLTVNKATTTTTVTPSPSAFGQLVTFNVT